MRVRLAFAVAAHLEPEILLVDEVLAVGDAEFQQKCLGKIGEVSRSGRTVIFVSHSAAAIEALCTRALLLRRGRLVFNGPTLQALEAAAAARAALVHQLSDTEGAAGAARCAWSASSCMRRRLDHREHPLGRAAGDRAAFRAARQQVPPPRRATFREHPPRRADLSPGELPHRHVFWRSAGTRTLVCRIPRLPLVDGTYHLGVRLLEDSRRTAALLDDAELAAELIVEKGDFFGSGMLPLPQEGTALVEGSWSLDRAA